MRHGKGIQEVASKAGVSITTVSHALSGKGRIAPDTRERIHRIAAELGYKPHATARNLAARKSGLLGLAVSQAGEQSLAFTGFMYFMQLMGAGTKAALDEGYALVLVPPVAGDRDPFESLPLDGAVIVDPVRDDPLVSRLRSRSVPFVTTGRIPDGPDDDHWVDNDHVAGTQAVLRHLERAGASRIALLTARPLASYALDAVGAYREWCAERGVEPLVKVTRAGLTETQGIAAAAELLDSESPPDAIYATIDTLALGVLRAAHARGTSVPDELLIASCTDNDALRMVEPPITAFKLHPDEIGRKAVEMLAMIVDGHEPAERHVILSSRIAPRASTRRGKRGHSAHVAAARNGDGGARRSQALKPTRAR